MKNYLKNMIAIGAAAFTLFTASPAVYATNQTKITEDYKVISQCYQLEHDKDNINKVLSNKTNPSVSKTNKDLAAKINKDLTNIKQQISQKKIPVNSFRIYGKDLTLEDYSRIINLTEKYNLKEGAFETFIRLEKVLGYEQFMNEVAAHYKIDKQYMIRTWNQESGFDIRRRGGHGERGLAQFQNLTAKLIFDRLISRGDYVSFDWKRLYPEFNIKKYSFEQLSTDYKLNIIMTAAQAKIIPIMLEDYLKKSNISQEQLIRIITKKGTTTHFEQLRSAIKNPENFGLNKELEKTLKEYNISNPRVSEVHKIYTNKSNLLHSSLDYIIYNGGTMAIPNITNDSVIGELLIYHLAMYLKNLGGLYNLMNCHYDGLENLVKSNEYLLTNLKLGKSINIWGHEIKNIDIKKFRTYSEHGLIENVTPALLDKDRLVIIKNSIIDENFNLQPLDQRLTKLCSVKDVDEMYDKLMMFKKLEALQTSLNKEYELKNDKKAKALWTKIVSIENEMNKKFKMQRPHTGITGIQKDITRIENDLKKSGFIPDIEKYNLMITPKIEQYNKNTGY